MTFDLVDIALSKRISNAKLQGWNEFPMMKMHFHFGWLLSLLACKLKVNSGCKQYLDSWKKWRSSSFFLCFQKKFDHISSALCLCIIIWTDFEAWPCPRVKTLFPFYDIVLLVLLQCSVGMEQRQDIERQLLHPTTNYSWGITFKEALPELMMEWRTLGNLYSITQKMP